MKQAFISIPVVAAAFVFCACGTSPAGEDVVDFDSLADIVADVQADTGGQDVVAQDAGRDQGTDDPGQGDVIDTDTTGQDILNQDTGNDIPIVCPGNLGCACDDNQDCYSGYCVETSGGKVCTKNCAGGNDCQRGWECTQVVVSGDSTYICTDPFARACRPCVNDADCVPSFGASSSAVYDCIPYGPDGSYCGGSCSGDEDCAEGFECVQNPDGAGQRCMAEDATCECLDNFIEQGYLTQCYVENDIGRCYGTRRCDTACNAAEPVEESCNLIDDDCDGNTDEGIAGTACENENEHGSCPGTAVCSNGNFSCDGKIPAPETCNGIDDDCDGQTDEDATNCIVFYLDVDDDGFGVSTDSRCLCQAYEDYSATAKGDCNDNDVNVYPGVIESCNGKDDNCDGVTDEAGAINCVNYYLDVDKDTWGVEIDKKCLCQAKDDYTAVRGGDCDDNDPDINGGVAESCNGIDDDCDGVTDEEDAEGCVEWYADVDGDTFGSITDHKCLCASTTKYKVDIGGDCNDANQLVNPAMSESCNDIDDNCDGFTDEEGAEGCVAHYYDNDGDHYGVGSPKCLCDNYLKYTALVDGDCNDSDGSVNPGITEVCNNKDDDCDGSTDEPGSSGCTNYFLDTDDDGFGVTNDFACLCSKTGDYTATVGGDCNDADEMMNPSMTEICNGKDDDCDTKIDEDNASGCTDYYLDADRDGFGDVSKRRCMCAPIPGTYDTTNASDCCDIDDNVYPGANPSVYYVAPTNCATPGKEWDYDCSGSNEKEETRTGGGCDGWAIGTGCEKEYGWKGSVVPACGVTGEFLTGGCGYTAIPVDCKDPVFSNRVQKCH